MINRTLFAVLLALPVITQGQDMPLSDILIEGEEWELVAEGFKFTEGPAADAVGNVFSRMSRATRSTRSPWTERSPRSSTRVIGQAA